MGRRLVYLLLVIARQNQDGAGFVQSELEKWEHVLDYIWKKISTDNTGNRMTHLSKNELLKRFLPVLRSVIKEMKDAGFT